MAGSRRRLRLRGVVGGTWSDRYVSRRFADITEDNNQAGHREDAQDGYRFHCRLLTDHGLNTAVSGARTPGGLAVGIVPIDTQKGRPRRVPPVPLSGRVCSGQQSCSTPSHPHIDHRRI